MNGRAVRPPRKRSMRGFTVLEMLVGLAIIATVMASASVLLRPPSAGLQVEASARALCAALRLTRSRAIASNTELVLRIDVAHKRFVSPVISATALPSAATVTFTVADRQRSGASTGGFLFFPSGSSTGGEVTISAPGRRALVSVNWLTGEARCDVS